MTQNSSALLERRTSGQEQPQKAPATAVARHRRADESMALWAMLFYLGLGLYACASILLGVWLIP